MALVPRHHRDDGTRAASHRARNRYGNRSRSHGTSTERPSSPEDVERDDRVVRAGRRIADGLGRGRRVRRVRDVPHADGAVVDAGGQQRRAVRSPPEAAVPVHLLGGDELGDAPHDVGIVVACEQAVAAAVGRGDAQVAAGDVRDGCAGGVEPRLAGGLVGGPAPWSCPDPRSETNSRPPSVKAARFSDVVRRSSPRCPGPTTRARSRRARSSADSCSSASPRIAAGSATSRSVPRSTSSTQSAVTGSSPAALRRNATRDPSSATVNARGAPWVNLAVTAC